MSHLFTLRALTAAAVVIAGAACLPALAQSGTPLSGVYVFGDSLSDGGNNYLTFGGLTGPNPSSNTFVPSLPYAPSAGFANRPHYSNGPSWVGSFAAGLGLGAFAAPSALGGGDYAYGGARMATDGTAPAPLPSNFPKSVLSQVRDYVNTGPAISTSSGLFVIAGGGNDVRDVGAAVAAGAPLVSTTTAAAAAYAGAALQMVTALKAAGANSIIVWTVPDVGKTPAAGAGVGAAAGAASFIAGAFNSALSSALSGSGVTIFDTYALMDNWVANPAAYGFTNVTQACGYAANNCDASHALFWDGIHPTAYTQGLLAGAMLAVAVPEPTSLMMLSAGGLLLLARCRRRRA